MVKRYFLLIILIFLLLYSFDSSSQIGPPGSTTTNVSTIVQQQAYGIDTTNINDYVATLSPAIDSYGNGVCYSVRVTNGNTTSVTLSLNGLESISVLKPDGGDLVNLSSGDLPSNSIMQVCYNGISNVFECTNCRATIFAPISPTGVLTDVNGITGLRHSSSCVTTNTDVSLPSHQCVNGGTTHVMPSATSAPSTQYWFTIRDNTANSVTFLPSGSELFNNTKPNITITGQDALAIFTVFNGQWHAITAEVPSSSVVGTQYIHIPVHTCMLPATNAAYIDGSGKHTSLVYDDATAQHVICEFILPDDAASAPTLKLILVVTPAVTETVTIQFDVSIWAINPGSADSIETESYATANACSFTLTGTANRRASTVCTLSTNDSVTKRSIVNMKIGLNTTASGNSDVIKVLKEFLVSYTR